MMHVHRLRSNDFLSAAAAVFFCVCTACSSLHGDTTIMEMRPGTVCAGSTTETEGSISRTHFWTVTLTKSDAVFTFDDRRVVLESVVGKEPLECRGNQQSGKAPDVVLALSGGRVARWKGYTIEVGDKLYDIAGPGTFTIDAEGAMKRQ
jgi:hypothetical protein